MGGGGSGVGGVVVVSLLFIVCGGVEVFMQDSYYSCVEPDPHSNVSKGSMHAWRMPSEHAWELRRIAGDQVGQ